MWIIRRRRARILPVAGLLLAVACLMVEPASAQRGFGRNFGGGAFDPPVNNVKYDGRFTFARIKYSVGPGGYYYRGLPAWAHGYNDAERNLTQILDALTMVHPRLGEGNVFGVDDPAFSEYPVAYMTEAGFWELTDAEAKAFGAYLQKGEIGRAHV